jgi:DNA-binding MarR family transcriptional regulator
MPQKTGLEIENQYCFPIYAASRVVIKLYTPLLHELGLTYPQYLTMLVLWQYNKLSVNDIGNKLMLESNTLTPLLKRLEKQGLISRNRSTHDERVVEISLTKEGLNLKKQASTIPEKLACSLSSSGIAKEELEQMKKTLLKLITTSEESNACSSFL